ncbi:MAG: HD-GYP domain-containing protein [Methylotenera sp.]|nr:HD-GYP domain-containing protein [Methylotenera sp.]HPH08009.1 HD-GYP domain-containing protein [Methylotenera sp.]HPM50050.1 HD-GYP domain-containing protein [Methylotenera sp.]
MLKTIPTHQVTLGMHIHALNGAWIDHPFWKSKFVLNDPEDLKKLRASSIKEVVIDIAKGVDVKTSETATTAPAATQPAESVAEQPKTPEEKKAVARVSAAEEQVRAKKILQESKKAVTTMLNDVRMGKAVNPGTATALVEEIASSVSRNESALISLVRLKTKDDYTYMHSVAVCALMIALAKELNLNDTETKQAGMAGLLHDVGKAGIPLEVLNKPGALTDDEFTLVKLHPERGHAMLMQANILDEVVLDVCLHHHEKVNGSGYPHKLKADNISLFAKMGAVCDVYDAVTSNRPYKAGWEPGVSLHRMAQWEGHFDDVVFKAFVRSIGIYPIGSMVKLKSGRLAVVVDQNEKSLLTPLVKVFFSTKSKTRIPVETLDLSKPSANDSIASHEDPATWGIHNMQEIWA